MHWSSMELLESNNLLAGWSGFELRSTPLQSKKITAWQAPLGTIGNRQKQRSICPWIFYYLKLNKVDLNPSNTNIYRYRYTTKNLEFNSITSVANSHRSASEDVFR